MIVIKYVFILSGKIVMTNFKGTLSYKKTWKEINQFVCFLLQLKKIFSGIMATILIKLIATLIKWVFLKHQLLNRLETQVIETTTL